MKMAWWLQVGLNSPVTCTSCHWVQTALKKSDTASGSLFSWNPEGGWPTTETYLSAEIPPAHDKSFIPEGRSGQQLKVSILGVHNEFGHKHTAQEHLFIFCLGTMVFLFLTPFWLWKSEHLTQVSWSQSTFQDTVVLETKGRKSKQVRGVQFNEGDKWEAHSIVQRVLRNKIGSFKTTSQK
jgi:hypothetical protein